MNCGSWGRRGVAETGFWKSFPCLRFSRSVISWVALPAYSGLNLKPFQIAGLWLAVMIAAPAAWWCSTLKLTTGVGAVLSAQVDLYAISGADSGNRLRKVPGQKAGVVAHHQPLSSGPAGFQVIGQALSTPGHNFER